MIFSLVFFFFLSLSASQDMITDYLYFLIKILVFIINLFITFDNLLTASDNCNFRAFGHTGMPPSQEWVDPSFLSA